TRCLSDWSSDVCSSDLATDVDALIRSTEGGLHEIVVDLEQQIIRDDRGFKTRFTADPYGRELLLQGLDEIGRTLLEEAAIAAYEIGRASCRERVGTAGG